MKVRFLKWMLGLFVLLGAAENASATWVTIHIEGVVDYVEDEGNYLEGKINVGTPISGYYRYDSDTPDQDWLWGGVPSPNVGRYHHFVSPYGVFLTAAGFLFQTDAMNVNFLLEMVNDYPSGDDYGVISYANVPLPNGAAVDHIAWHLNDPTGTALESDALPTGAPDLSDWDGTYALSIWGDRMYGIKGHITSAVPEPGTLLLFLFGSAIATKLGLKKR